MAKKLSGGSVGLTNFGVVLAIMAGVLLSPLHAVGWYLGAGALLSALPAVSVLTMSAFSLFGQPEGLSLPRRHPFDLWMGLFLLTLALSLPMTVALTASPSQALTILRHIYLIPAAYFGFRITIRENQRPFRTVSLLWILMFCVLYLLLEFIEIQWWVPWDKLQRYFITANGGARIYDGLAGNYVKPAGPIHGSQNASILALISIATFGLTWLRSRRPIHFLGITLAALSLLVSVTATALLGGLILSLLLLYAIPDGKIRDWVRLPILAVALVGAVGWKEIVSLKAQGTMSSTTSSHYSGVLLQDIERVLTGMERAPWGTGWPHPGLATGIGPALLENLDAVRASANEIFLFRVVQYCGVPLLLALLLLHLAAVPRIFWLMLNRPRNQVEYGICLAITLSLFLSTIHYDSFVAPGFAILNAFAFAWAAGLENSEIHHESY